MTVSSNNAASTEFSSSSHQWDTVQVKSRGMNSDLDVFESKYVTEGEELKTNLSANSYDIYRYVILCAVEGTDNAKRFVITVSQTFKLIYASGGCYNLAMLPGAHHQKRIRV